MGKSGARSVYLKELLDQISITLVLRCASF